MSLKTALINPADIEINNGILTVSDFMSTGYGVSYQCFVKDIQLNHPSLGKGRILTYDKNRFICDFEYSTSLEEVKPKTLLNYLPSN